MTISNNVIQMRAIKLIAIAKGAGKIGNKSSVIIPSLTPNPPGAKITTKPVIQDKIYAADNVNIFEMGIG
ncbi:unnamed protein product [marine sediment metagenome]|uniref:Uncharacterized protein n=1 Tax=marine sediment metagenome TaxID=412755 RepID=X1SYY8_9ZZZZ